MKKLLSVIIIAGLCGCLVSCGGKHSATTTPEKEKNAGGPAASEGASAGPSQAAGPQSDLCTDTNCPGVVR